MPFLMLEYRGVVIRHYPLESGKVLSIGRDNNNDIWIGDPAVSDFHARLVFQGEGALISDLGSQKGTYVNGVRVEEASLSDGDTLALGAYRLVFSDERRGADPSVIDTADLENGRQRGRGETMGDPFPILLFKKGGTGRILLENRYTRMGRSRSNEVVVTGLLMGKRAATVVRRDDGYYINHVSGFLKPRLNGAVVGKEPERLRHADMISLGRARLRFLSRVRRRKV